MTDQGNTRRGFLKGGAVVAASAFGVAALRADTALAPTRLPVQVRHLPVQVSLSFANDRPRQTWSDAHHHWLSVMPSRRQGVAGGAAFLVLPDAAPTSARLQPTPVFLLDHDCTVHEQAMVFRDNAKKVYGLQ